MKTFTEVLNGTLFSAMHWAQWDALQQVMLTTRKEGWYVYFVGEAVPGTRVCNTEFEHILKEIHALLQRDHEEAYLGIVYTDDFDTPSLVKIYDPNNLGASCGSSGKATPPGWVISKMPPEHIHTGQIMPQGRKRWWHGLFSFQ